MNQESGYKTNCVILSIVLLTTFIPSVGSYGIIKLLIVTVLYLIKGNESTTDNYVLSNLSVGQQVIKWWLTSILLASIAVTVTEGAVNIVKISHEISRVFYYLFVINLCFKISITLKQLFYACSIVILIHTVIQISQYLQIGSFDDYIIQYYLQGDTENQHYLLTKQLYGEAFRSGSIFINPNVYVCYPYLSLGVFLTFYHETRGYIPLMMVAVAFVSVVLTGSRMGIITYICIIGWYFWYSSRHKSSKHSNKGFVIILALVILVIFNWQRIANMAEGFRAFSLDSAYQGSSSIKLEGILGYLSISNPLEWLMGSLGCDRLAIPIDMEWGYIFAWFGVFGMFWYLKLIKLIYNYHKSNYRIMSTIAAMSIILTAMGASSVLNMSVFPYICTIAFTNIIPQES